MRDDLEKVCKEMAKEGQNGRMRLNRRGKCKVHPRTVHEDLEGE
jgi:hypothetical protein